jgi:AAA+ ATPase superfamily predicted ATPase
MFDYGKPVTGKLFFDRSGPKKEISIFIKSGVDFMIKAPRRYGKTSLVEEVLGNEKHIYLDFRRVPRLSLIPEEILNQAYEIVGIKGFIEKAKKNVISLIKEAKLSCKVDMGIVEIGAEIAFEGSEKKSDCEKLVEALEVVDKIGKELGHKISIVYDEFQDIKKFQCSGGDILEVLRGTLQHKQYIHSIFLGSIESIMTKIFENKKSPFFNYCRKIHLLPFDIKELYTELIMAFGEEKIVFEDEKILPELLQKLGGHPANTMLVMQTLYFMTLQNNRKLIKKEDTLAAFNKAYYEQIDLITQYVSEMKTKKNYHDVMYRMAMDEEQVLNAQSLYQVRSGLIDMGLLVLKERNTYFIADNFLEAYLKNCID